MKSRKLIIPLLLFTVVLACCNGGEDTATMYELASIDSLLTQARDNVAAQIRLDSLDPEGFSKAERAYYSLLMTQAHYKNLIDDTTDAVINVAVDYYKNHGDNEKRTRSLLYQGCVYEVMGKHDKAIENYKRIEDVADDDDLENRAYAKMRLVELYAPNLYYTEPKLKLAKEALDLYRQLGDKHYQVVCLTSLGSMFREDSVNYDSAFLYIGEAIRLAEAEHETWFEFQNRYHRAELYCLLTKEYKKAKADILKAIEVGKNEIDHPRAHFIAAETYLNLGQRDSAVYYLNHAPALAVYADTVMYYRLQSEIAKYDKNWEKYTKYYVRANSISDSILINSVRKNYQAVEKKYDLQLAELNKVKYQSRWRGALLLATLLALLASGLAFLAWRYRNRLKMKENEAEMLKSDLDVSLASLRQMQATIGTQERELKSAQEALRGNEVRMSEELASLEARKRQSDEMRAIVDNQIQVIHQLLQLSYENNGATFLRKFNEVMALPGQDAEPTESYWTNLHTLANELHNNVLVEAQRIAGGTLNESEVNFLALYCCGFSRTVIMICMKYSNLGTVSNKKLQIAKKLGVTNLDDFADIFRL